jgi:hypothetical protein
MASLMAPRLKVAVLILCALSVPTGTFAGDPKSQAEIDQRYPLPQKFGAFDIFAARTLAKSSISVMDSALNDYPSTRFRSVRAVLQADWRSWKRFYYLCGQINGKNRMGAYIGWRNFLVTDNGNAPPDFTYEGQADATFLIPRVCSGGRADRLISDDSVEYGKLIAAE